MKTIIKTIKLTEQEISLILSIDLKGNFSKNLRKLITSKSIENQIKIEQLKRIVKEL